MATRQPSAAKASAVARPIPWLEAATITTRPLRPVSISLELYVALIARVRACSSSVREFNLITYRTGVPMKRHKFRPETESVHGGANLDKRNAPMAQPIYQTSTFQVTDSDQQLQATHTDMFYTRYGNPTHTAVEARIAELESADAALLFASGMNAITTSLLSLVKSGDHIVAQRDIYGGVTKFLSTWLPKLGVETTFVDTTDYDQHARAIRPN